ncbi:unnamed protein product [Arabis nemorensis]|uniref:RRM domain-containing protein n=1 Tax=Arabis nemorensis TaxID=586526 RepID=A0A565BIL4_9BRAS|nr:unnamed protein product [Arabis nemorensis]
MVNICLIARFFLIWLRQLHTLHDPGTTLQRSFGKGFNYLPLEVIIKSTLVTKTTCDIFNDQYFILDFYSINFFKDVGEVVNHTGKHEGYGFVEFASTKEAKKALEKKNGEYLQDCKIYLEVATVLHRSQCLVRDLTICYQEHIGWSFWYEDYLRRENLLVEEDYLPDIIEAKKKQKFCCYAIQSPSTHANTWLLNSGSCCK